MRCSVCNHESLSKINIRFFFFSFVSFDDCTFLAHFTFSSFSLSSAQVTGAVIYKTKTLTLFKVHDGNFRTSLQRFSDQINVIIFARSPCLVSFGQQAFLCIRASWV